MKRTLASNTIAARPARDLEERVRYLEARLREYESTDRRYRSLLDHMPDLVIRVGRDLRYIEGNARFFEVFDVAPETMVGRAVGTISAEHAGSWIDIFRGVFQTGEPREVSFAHDTRRGRRWFEARVVPEVGPDGEITSLLSVSRDVTDRRLGEEALRASEARLRLLMEQAPAILWSTDARLRFTSLAGAALTGVAPAQDILGRTVAEVLHVPDDNATVDAHRRALRGERVDYDLAFDDRVFRCRVEPLRDGQGDAIGVIGVSLDLTELHQAEATLKRLNAELEARVAERTAALDEALEALRQSEVMFRSLLRDMPDALYVAELSDGPDSSLRIVLANESAARMIGCSAEALLGRSLLSLCSGRTSEEHIAEQLERVRRGQTIHLESEHRRDDGSTFPVDLTARAVRYGDRRVVMALVRDVTEQKRNAELQRQHLAELAHAARLSMMGEMASGLAHELNQPLAAIANYARGCLRRLEAKGIADDSLEEALDRIAAQAERSGQIIQRSRHFVRKRELQRTTADLCTLAREAVLLMEPELRQNEVELVYDLAGRTYEAHVDAIQIEQVLLNLLRNGMESMANIPVERRRLVLSCGVSEGYAVIRVTDAGSGLSDEQLARVFEPFYTTKSNGMGMGLSISRTIVEAHGGRLSAESNPGGGATFVVRLPLVQCD